MEIAGAALVTGASRGIGRAVAERLARAGLAVAGLYAQADDAAAAVEAALRAEGRTVTLCRCPVTDHAAVGAAVREAEERFGPLEVLVNCAGITRDGLVALMPEADFRAVFEVSFVGACHCCAAVLPGMRARGHGRIVNVVSISGQRGRAGQANYACAKGAVMGLTTLLARRCAGSGVRVNAVAPGLIDTDMARALPPERRDRFLAATHVGRLGTAAEVAEAVLFLAGPGAGYVSGQVLTVDGGYGL